MKLSIMSVALVSLLAGCASHQARDSLNVQDPTVLQSGFGTQQSVEAGAPTTEWLARYQGMYAKTMLPELEQRLRELSSDASAYDGAKAACWISAAREEYKSGNQWGFVPEAMGEADRLLSGLERKQVLSADNPKLRTVSDVRPDLWAKIGAEKKKADAKKDCDEPERILACGEVQLMHAGHEAWRRSFGQSEKRVDTLIDDMSGIDAKIARCPRPVVEANEPMTGRPTIRIIKADALFHFDRGDEAGMLPDGKDALDRLANELEQRGDVKNIELVGYADRLGTPSHNDGLSTKRADTVRRYLQMHGLGEVPMRSHGEGSRDPLVECNDTHRTALIDCLAPDRRVELLIYADSNVGKVQGGKL
jgi:OmpA-OmpF porin, OOP family